MKTITNLLAATTLATMLAAATENAGSATAAPPAAAPKTETVKVYTTLVRETGKPDRILESAKLTDAYKKGMKEQVALKDAGIPMKRGGKKGVGRLWSATHEEKNYLVLVGETTKTVAMAAEPAAK